MKKKNIYPKPVKVPTTLQMEAAECGAASLDMVLSYYGKFIPLEELRIVCGISRDGSKASNMMKAARAYGLEGKGYRKDPAELKKMPGPTIIHWNFNHFVVFLGYRKGHFYLNDPGSGHRIVSEEEFDQSFTGIVLSFKPGPKFKKSGRKPSLVRSLQKRLHGSWNGLTYLILVQLSLVIPGLLIPVFSKIFIDDILLGNNRDWFLLLIIGLGFTAVLRGILTWVQRYFLVRMETKLSLTTSGQFLWHILRLPVEFFTQRMAGDICVRMQSNDRIAQLLSGRLATNVLNAIMIIFYFILMYSYSPHLALVGAGVTVLNVVYLQMVSRKRVDLNRRLVQDTRRLMGTSMAGLQAIETLKATGSESDFFVKWSGHQTKQLVDNQEIGVSTQFLNAVPSFLNVLTNSIVLVYGGFLIMDGQMTIGMLVAFQSLMISFITPVSSLVGLGSELQEVKGEMENLDDVLRYPIDQSEKDVFPDQIVVEDTQKLTGQMDIVGLSFGYNPLEPPLIEGFTLHLKPGSRVALVGRSGSGKSTVAKLITGIYKKWSGEILFDGKKREVIESEVISNSLAIVDQDICLLSGTIRDNLTLWDTTVDEQDIVRAAKDACIHDDITSRPGGYDAVLDEQGTNFSGGQRQRLEIARALINNPSILIFDEATSALDTVTERKIDENLRRRGCTTIIVAHRLSTIRDCDEIILLDRGKIAQRGTHDELKGMDGHYAHLIEAG